MMLSNRQLMAMSSAWKADDMSSLSRSVVSKDRYEVHADADRSKSSSDESTFCTSSSTDNGVGGGISLVESTLNSIVEGFRLVEVKDRMWHLKQHKQCFVGSDAVDLLVSVGYAKTRLEAVGLGRIVADEYDLFEHVSDKNRKFEDDFVLYRFKQGPHRKEEQEDESDEESDAAPSPIRPGSPSREPASPSPPSPTQMTSRHLSNATLKELAKAARVITRVEVKDRKFRLTTYSCCFLGNEAVDLLITSGCAHSREHAVQIGRQANQQFALFEHVRGEHLLEDNFLFYRFKERNKDQTQPQPKVQTRKPTLSPPPQTQRSTSRLQQTQQPHQQQQHHQQPRQNASSQTSRRNSLGTSSSILSSRDKIQDVIVLLRTVEVRDRAYHLKIYKNCFVGSQAVDLLVEAGYAKSRSEAVWLGRKINERFHIFEHVCGEHLLEDDLIFYRFGHVRTISSGSLGAADQESRKKIHAQQQQQQQTLQKDAPPPPSHQPHQPQHQQHQRPTLLPERSLRSIMSIGSKQLHAFQHQEKEQQRPSLAPEKSKSSRSVTRGGRSDTSSLFSKEKSMVNIRAVEPERFYRHGSGSSNMLDSREGVQAVVSMLRAVEVKDRTYHLKHYKQCFVGSDAVDMLVEAGYASSREEAVKIARKVNDRFTLFEHVCGNHLFEDDHKLYRFFDRRSTSLGNLCTEEPKRRIISRETGSQLTEVTPPKESQQHPQKQKAPSSPQQHKNHRNHHHHHQQQHRPSAHPDRVHRRNSSGSTLLNSRERVQAVINMLRTVEVRDRAYHLKVYKNCFVGSEAVDLLLEAGYAKSRHEAVWLARKINDRFKIFEHVCGDHLLEDDFLFYRFVEKKALSTGSLLIESKKKGMPAKQQSFRGTTIASYPPTTKNIATEQSTKKLAVQTRHNHHHEPFDSKGNFSDEGDEHTYSTRDQKIIEGLARVIQMVEVKDRRFHLKTYKQCFVGAEVVDLLLLRGLAKSRSDAVRIGRIVNREMDLFSHVCDEHPFEDGFLFYRFNE